MFSDIIIRIYIGLFLAFMTFLMIEKSFCTTGIFKNKWINIVATIPTLILTIGIIGFVGGAFLSLGLYKIIPDSFEMPLGSLKSLAVDSEGNIYCGAQFYSRVQVYDSKGKFLYGKSFDSSGGAFIIRINSNDQLEIATYRGKKEFIFAKNGKLLSKRSNVPNFFSGFDKTNNYYCHDQKRDITYQIKPILFPFETLNTPETIIAPFGSHIVKKDASGKETVVIKTAFYKWLFMGPFPAWILIAFGGILNFIFNPGAREKMLGIFET